MNKKILIIGLGLIGGSYAEALTSLGYEVSGIDTNASSIDYALNKKIIISGATTLEEQFVKQFDVIIFALYPHVLIDYIEKYQHMFKSGALLNDVTGVKEYLINKIDNTLRDDIDFVFSHPMAGKEKSGIKFADKNIFKNANFIITPTSKNKQDNIEFISSMAHSMGFKNVSLLSPKEHDEMIGFLSQLTHCIAISLMTCKDSKNLYEYTGDSFKDLTRIAKINEDMWAELFLINKKQLLEQMDLFINQFNSLKLAIENEDEDKIKQIMELSTERRNYFDD